MARYILDKLAIHYKKGSVNIDMMPKKRLGNNELATHIAKYNHDFEIDIDVMILQNNLKASAEREYYEDRYICLLGTKQPHGLNQDVSAFANEMYDYVQLLH